MFHKQFNLIDNLDATASCKGSTPSRCNTFTASAFFYEQAETSNQHRQMDARRTASADWSEQWRVYFVERHGLQFRNYHAGELHCPEMLDPAYHSFNRHMTLP